MLSFKPTFSLSSFTFIKRLFSSSSLSAIRVVSSVYLRYWYMWNTLVICVRLNALSSSAACLLQPTRLPVPGILQARTLEWVAISFSSAWKWKVKVKSLSRVWLLATPWTAAHQASPSMGFSRQKYWSGVPLPSPSPLLPTCNQSWNLIGFNLYTFWYMTSYF